MGDFFKRNLIWVSIGLCVLGIILSIIGIPAKQPLFFFIGIILALPTIAYIIYEVFFDKGKAEIKLQATSAPIKTGNTTEILDKRENLILMNDPDQDLEPLYNGYATQQEIENKLTAIIEEERNKIIESTPATVIPDTKVTEIVNENAVGSATQGELFRQRVLDTAQPNRLVFDKITSPEAVELDIVNNKIPDLDLASTLDFGSIDQEISENFNTAESSSIATETTTQDYENQNLNDLATMVEYISPAVSSTVKSQETPSNKIASENEYVPEMDYLNENVDDFNSKNFSSTAQKNVSSNDIDLDEQLKSLIFNDSDLDNLLNLTADESVIPSGEKIIEQVTQYTENPIEVKVQEQKNLDTNKEQNFAKPVNQKSDNSVSKTLRANKSAEKKELLSQSNLEKYLQHYFIETAACFLMDRNIYKDSRGIAPYNKITIKDDELPEYCMSSTKGRLYKFCTYLIDVEKFITHPVLYHDFTTAIEKGVSLVRISETLHTVYRKKYKKDFLLNLTHREDWDNIIILVFNNYILDNDNFKDVFTRVPFEIPVAYNEQNIIDYLSDSDMVEKFLEKFPSFTEIGIPTVWDAIYICFINSIKNKLTVENLESAILKEHKKIARALRRSDNIRNKIKKAS